MPSIESVMTGGAGAMVFYLLVLSVNLLREYIQSKRLTISAPVSVPPPAPAKINGKCSEHQDLLLNVVEIKTRQVIVMDGLNEIKDGFRRFESDMFPRLNAVEREVANINGRLDG